jgi:hypothetical protein
MKLVALAPCLLALPVILASPAEAGRRHGGPVFYNSQPPYPGDEYGKQGGRWCRRMCAEDRNPCDPIQFKLADGRCDPFD